MDRKKIAAIAAVPVAALLLAGCTQEAITFAPEGTTFAGTFDVRTDRGLDLECIYLIDDTADHAVTGGMDCWTRGTKP